jgi:hypothetical protein
MPLADPDLDAAGWLVADCLSDAIARLTGADLDLYGSDSRWRNAVVAAYGYMADHATVNGTPVNFPRPQRESHERLHPEDAEKHNLPDGMTMTVGCVGARVVVGLVSRRASYGEVAGGWSPALAPEIAEAICEALIRCAREARANARAWASRER